MTLETFLVVLEKDAPAGATAQTVSALEGLGSQVAMVAGEGKAIVATFDRALADRVRRLPHVRLVGGVRIRRRTLARKRK